MALPASWPVSYEIVSESESSVERALAHRVDDCLGSFSTGAAGGFLWVDGVFTRVGGVYTTQ